MIATFGALATQTAPESDLGGTIRIGTAPGEFGLPIEYLEIGAMGQ
ncbi:hypothetical protein [Nocardia sp. NPDC020380]